MNIIEEIKNRIEEILTEGGSGSGNFGHAGRPGEVGGSGEGGVGGEKGNEEYGHRIKGFTPTEKNRISSGIPSNVAARMKDTNSHVQSVAQGMGGIRKSEPDDIKKLNRDTSLLMQRQGKCFELSGRFVIDNKGWELVHATTYPRIGSFANKIYFHGFAQRGNTVYDVVFDKFYDKIDYYDHYSISDIRKYSRDATLKRALRTRNWGPWD